MDFAGSESWCEIEKGITNNCFEMRCKRLHEIQFVPEYSSQNIITTFTSIWGKYRKYDYEEHSDDLDVCIININVCKPFWNT